MERYTVLTFHCGDYEKVHEIVQKSPNADYILVTDNPNLKSETWEVIYDPNLTGTPLHNFLYVRWHPWEYTKNDIVVRVDGSIQPLLSFDPIVETMLKENKEQAYLCHPTRQTLWEEYNTWVGARNYPQEQAIKCLQFYQQVEGYPLDYKGLVEMCFFIQKRTQSTRAFNNMVWGLCLYLAPADCDVDRLDQTIASFVLNKYFPNVPTMFIYENLVFSKFMQWYAHNSDTPIKGSILDFKTPYTYNQICYPKLVEDFA